MLFLRTGQWNWAYFQNKVSYFLDLTHYICVLVDPAGQFCLLVYKNPLLSFVFTQVWKCLCFAEGFGFSLHYEQMTLQKATELSRSSLLTGHTNRIGRQWQNFSFRLAVVKKKEVKKKPCLRRVRSKGLGRMSCSSAIYICILVPIAIFVSLSRRGLGTRKRFLVPRPRRLRETKRALGTRMLHLLMWSLTAEVCV